MNSMNSNISKIKELQVALAELESSHLGKTVYLKQSEIYVKVTKEVAIQAKKGMYLLSTIYIYTVLTYSIL